MISLLPPNASALERDLEATQARIEDIPVPLREVWNPDTCPVDLLPWLAWTFSVDGWDSEWSEAVKRQVIKDSVQLHRKKGTPFAVRRALESLGYDQVVITEGARYHRHGKFRRDGSISHGSDMHWAEFDVQLNAGFVPDTDQQAKISAYIDNYKPLRSHLRNLSYSTKFHNGQHLRDGSITRDGGFV